MHEVSQEKLVQKITLFLRFYCFISFMSRVFLFSHFAARIVSRSLGFYYADAVQYISSVACCLHKIWQLVLSAVVMYTVSVDLFLLVSLFVVGCSLIVPYIVVCCSVEDYFALVVIDVKMFTVRVS
jgi:hypothetical protein